MRLSKKEPGRAQEYQAIDASRAKDTKKKPLIVRLWGIIALLAVTVALIGVAVYVSKSLPDGSNSTYQIPGRSGSNSARSAISKDRATESATQFHRRQTWKHPDRRRELWEFGKRQLGVETPGDGGTPTGCAFPVTSSFAGFVYVFCEPPPVTSTSTGDPPLIVTVPPVSSSDPPFDARVVVYAADYFDDEYAYAYADFVSEFIFELQLQLRVVFVF
ncbi:hypothetical protein CMUS01_15027 [Colletotrichum musicola]|uniref:Uncharacterized protein n=1 Tax=Colletotrichum musicola TaxID=2175873 RepID=A0A8H6IZD3_9PEZI|nr:hypothetical protein CMUS01_15027 [Colletotrichum musicola]